MMYGPAGAPLWVFELGAAVKSWGDAVTRVGPDPGRVCSPHVGLSNCSARGWRPAPDPRHSV